MKELYRRFLICSVAFAVGTCSSVTIAQTAQTTSPSTSTPEKTSKPAVNAKAKVIWVNTKSDSVNTKVEDIDIDNIAKILKERGIEINMVETETTTSANGTAPAKQEKTKIIHLGKDGYVTKELNGTDNLDAEIKKALEDADLAAYANNAQIITIDKDGSSNGKSNSFTITTNTDGKNKQCNVKFSCDTSKKGKCFAFSVNGVDTEILKTVQEGIKGLDEKTQKLITDKLRSLQVNVSIPDSAMVMTLDASEAKDGDVHANVQVFVANDDAIVSTGNNNDVKVNVRSVVSDGKSTVKKVYVFRMKKDGADEQKKVITETTPTIESLKLDNFALAPNPSEDGKFSLKFSVANQADTRVRITDINGREVYTEQLSNFNGAYDKTLDLSQYGKGVYVVNVQQADKSAAMKLVIE